MIREVKLPEVSENVESGEVTKVLVSVGDVIEKDQPVVELETDKAVVDVPSPFSGKVTEVNVKAGETIKIDQLLIKVETEEIKAAEKEAPKAVKAPKEAEKKSEAEKETAHQKEGEKEKQAERREIQEPELEKPAVAAQVEEEIQKEAAPAAPSVRRLARELGVDINYIEGSGPRGRISLEDVKKFTKEVVTSGTAVPGAPAGTPVEKLPDFSKWGEIEILPMNNVRKKTAEHLSYAWATIPHVTQFDKGDITELENLRKKYSERVKESGGKLTMTAILLKVCAAALKVFPQFNASIDMQKREVIYKKYVNMGIAVDTERGLLVPVIRNVDKKNITQLSVELTEIAEKARNGKLSLEDMQGGNFSISNLGGIGGTYFSPVINSPEVAILGVSRSVVEPVFIAGQFQSRLMLPLSLSYDHRIIDGADAIRFLRWVVEALEQPFFVMLEG